LPGTLSRSTHSLMGDDPSPPEELQPEPDPEPDEPHRSSAMMQQPDEPRIDGTPEPVLVVGYRTMMQALA
jgi:hypothetical protein